MDKTHRSKPMSRTTPPNSMAVWTKTHIGHMLAAALHALQSHATTAFRWFHRTGAADELWKVDPFIVAVAPFLLSGRFWEAHGGWSWLDCPHAASSEAPCDGELAPRAVFEAWRRAAVPADEKPPLQYSNQ